MFMNRNPILNTDSYKGSHFAQTPPDLTHMSSYVEARGSQDKSIKETVVIGIYAGCHEVFGTPITMANIDEAEDVFTKHGFNFNRAGWEYILEKHDGFIPVEVVGVPEGTVLPISTPMMQIVNTDPELPWLTSYFETALLRAIWYATTVATKSREIKKVLKRGMMETAGHCEGLDFMLHDFGCRGVSSYESAAIGGLAHLVNFQGTDTLPAIVYGRKHYNIDMAGYSVPASEHSTITSWGMQNELLAHENMMDNFGVDNGTFSSVSDSFNIYETCRKYWGGILKDRVIEFGSRGGTTVVRPDSGPLLESPSVPIECVQILMECFGHTVNELGFKVLPKYIRVLQGDGWKEASDFVTFIKLLKAEKISMENFVFGMGGGLLQNVNRDVFKFAMKASAVKDDKGWRDVYKNPVHKGKKSKKGHFTSVNLAGDYTTGEDDLLKDNILVTYYKDGTLTPPDDFEKIRKRAEV